MKKFFLMTAVMLYFGGAFAVAQEEEAPAKAQFRIGGWVGASTSVVGGDSDKDTITAGVNVGSQTNAPSLIGRINASGETADGKFGGFVRFDIRNFWPGGSDNGFAMLGKSLARAYWAPNKYFKATLGNIDQGAVNYVVGWGFFANDMEDFMVTWSNPSAGGGTSWYGMGRGGETTWYVGPDNRLGFGFAVTPITGLSLNFFAPLLGTNGFEAEEIYKHSMGQIQYSISGIGDISLAYWSGNGLTHDDNGTADDDTDDKYSPDPGKVYASFYLTAVEKLGINLGVRYTLPVKGDNITINPDWEGKNAPFNGVNSGSGYKKIVSPVNIGLGAQYTFNDFVALKARFAASVAGKSKRLIDGRMTLIRVPYDFSTEFCPVFSIKDLKVLIPLGIVITEGESDPMLTWHFSPVVQKGLGPASVFAGVQLKDNGKITGVEWAIPIGIIVAF
ncbi:MAG: hypothetical protein Ta2G_02680 [Termitinemataceae bacterium]|nr:MAG: hypothetical protein Ta2G_02680 [Termitinemataceae bacterium]